MMRPRLIIFDCDGTLVDSQHHIIDAMTIGLTDRGHAAPDPGAVRATVGLSLIEAVARLLPDHEPHEHEQVAEGYKQAHISGRVRGDMAEPLYPGIVETLQELDRAGYLLGVATGKGRRGLDHTLSRHGIAGLFVTLQTADRCRGKPHPEMIDKALAETGVERRDAMMIGDTTFDMEMAVNAGVTAVGVSWGYHPASALQVAGAKAIIDEIAALPAILAAAWGGTT